MHKELEGWKNRGCQKFGREKHVTYTACLCKQKDNFVDENTCTKYTGMRMRMSCSIPVHCQHLTDIPQKYKGEKQDEKQTKNGKHASYSQFVREKSKEIIKIVALLHSHYFLT